MIWTKPEIRSFGEDQLLKELEVQAQYHGDGSAHQDVGPTPSDIRLKMEIEYL